LNPDPMDTDPQPMFNGWNINEKSKNFFVKTYTIFKYLFGVIPIFLWLIFP
jgi:hypothetical protein